MQYNTLRDQLTKASVSSTTSIGAATPSELASRRLALSKIGNDINRVTNLLQQAGNDTGLMTVTSYSSSTSVTSSSSGGVRVQQQQQVLAFQAIQGQEVDDMIMEERARDITRINQDIQIVNEMFQDMANIVQTQQPMVEQIHKTTEEASVHAKQGLEQVNQAAAYQPVCIVM